MLFRSDFAAEGADIIFLEAPENEAEMRAFCSAISKPCMANMVIGGKTPELPPAQLQALGYKIAAYPLVLVSAAIAAMQQALKALAPNSNTPQPPTITFPELQRVVGFPEYWAAEEKYKAE